MKVHILEELVQIGGDLERELQIVEEEPVALTGCVDDLFGDLLQGDLPEWLEI